MSALRLLRVAHRGAWENRLHEATFHAAFMLVHLSALSAAPLHVMAVLHHGTLALKGLVRR
jgi:hypothetical protein